MWQVRITKVPTVPGLLKPGYFPRLIRYKEDAERLRAEVVHKGGDAVVEKASKGRVIRT